MLLVAAAALVAAVVLIWFQPQKLFIDTSVNEPAPAASGRNAPGGGEGNVLARGMFRSLAHHGTGDALLLTSGDSTIVRLENLDVENGPDLRVYLSTAPSVASAETFNDEFVDLGALKANMGNQNYAVPRGVDARDYRSVVVWCRRFSVGFAVAPLNRV